MKTSASDDDEENWSIADLLQSLPYRLFLAAYCLDELCNAIWMVTLGLVIARTPTHLDAGGILLLTGLPLAAVLVFFSGWIDRHTSRKIALYTLAARVVLMIAWVLVASMNNAPFVAVAVLGGLLGALSGLHEPAMIAYPTQILPEEAQSTAAIAERSSHRLAQAAGGIIVGYLITLGDLGTPATVGVIAVFAAWLIVRRLDRTLPGPQPEEPSNRPLESVGSSIVGGKRFVFGHRILAFSLPVQTALTIALMSTVMVGIPFRTQAQHWDGHQFGWIYTVFATGMTVSIIATWSVQRWSARRQITLSYAMTVLTGLTVIALGFVTTLAPTMIIMAILGLSSGPAGPLLSGYLRAEAAAADKQAPVGTPSIVGRASAMLILFTDAAEPFGYLIAVGLAIAFPAAVTFWVMGAICVIAAVVALLGLQRVASLRPGLPVRDQSSVQ